VPDWPIIADPDGKLAGQLAVHGWPTALVIQSDGLQVARIGGAPESFAFKLAPYLDVATKKLDRVIVEAQLAAKPKMVSDGPDRLPTRQLQIARKLLDDGNPREAQKVLIQALAAQPDSVLLKLAMAQTLIALDRWDDARNLLQGLLEKSPQTPEAHFLLGKVYEHADNAQGAFNEYRTAAAAQR
jgi:predicted Zn-dependent protease